MSVDALSWALRTSGPDAPHGSARLVLIVLADMADEAGSCFPRVSLIAERANLTAKNAKAAIRRLEEMGLVRTVQRPVPGSKNRSNRYFLSVPGAADPYDIDDQIGGSEQPPTGRSEQTPTGGPEQTPITITSNPHQEEPPYSPPAGTSPQSVAVADNQHPSGPSAEEVLSALWHFWPSFRRPSRKLGVQKVAAALRVATPEQIIESARRHSEVWVTYAPDDQQFIPMMTTWLNQHRWEIDAAPPRATAPSPARRRQDEHLAVIERMSAMDAAESRGITREPF